MSVLTRAEVDVGMSSVAVVGGEGIRVRQVHVSQTLAEAYLIKGVLDVASIEASVRGEHVVADVGVRSATAELRPSVWVGDSDAERAMAVLQEYLRDSSPGEALLGLGEAADDATRVGGRFDDGDVDYEDMAAADDAAQRVMSDLFVLADRLAHEPRRGDLLDEVYRCGAFVAEVRAPFGIDVATWERIAHLSVAVVSGFAAGDEARVQEACRVLRDFLRRLV